MEIFRTKNLATKFQILAEIANRGPYIQQREIARKLAVTPQAISDYIKQLVNEHLLVVEGRSRYRITAEGVNWMIKVLGEMESYHAFVEQAITNISISAAIADSDLHSGQTVGLEMKEGLLFATKKIGGGSKGTAFSDAAAGEDVGVANIEGIVNLETGKVIILKVPSVQNGGSRLVDIQRLRKEVAGKRLVGGMGIEAIVALRKVNAQFAYTYGVVAAAIEAARSGLSPLIVCVDDQASSLIRRLEEEKIDYELIDVKKVDSQS